MSVASEVDHARGVVRWGHDYGRVVAKAGFNARPWCPRGEGRVGGLATGRTESASAARGLAEFALLPFDGLVAGYDQLRDAIAGLDGVGFFSLVVEDHAHFPAVTRVDGARRVRHGDAVFQRKSAAGPHLAFITGGEFQDQTGGDGEAIARLESHRGN